MFQHYSYADYLKKTFSGKTYKVVVSSGLTCPTRDGNLDWGGCSFCDVRGSASYYGGKAGDDRTTAEAVRKQIESRMPAMRERFGADHFLAYFQSYTNTYADAAYLEEIYDAALGTPGITGLCIGTRPDCLPEPVLELLGRLSEKHYVSVELGVQSLHDPTLKWLERGHDAESSVRALRLLAERAPKAQTCAHLMFGSPTEPEGIFQTTAQTLSDLPLHGVKLHQLMILERTKLAKLYREAPFHVLELEEYARGVHTFLEHLRPDIYLERLAANATHRDECIAPEWSKTRWETHNTLRELLDSWDTIQGRSLPRTGESFVGASRSTEQALELSASR